MLDKVIKTIDENNMFVYGDRVIVGVSGGPDSMCLLHMLNSIKERYGLSLAVAHINHCLRGEEADEDEEFVMNYCKTVEIDFYSTRVDVEGYAKKNSLSCEAAGREVRYNFFRELMKKLNAQKIALAHNANDTAETILMRIIRGTGIEGLTGIKPVRDEIFVRPLINLSREEIERYCRDNNISVRIDRTNMENIYARNKIRLELIPYIDKNFKSDIVKGLNRLADTLKKDNDFLENTANEKFKMYCDVNDKRIIISKEAFKEHEAILTRIIRRCLSEITGSLYNFEKIHIYDIINNQQHDTGKVITLPKSVIATNIYGDIEIAVGNLHNPKDEPYKKEEYSLHMGCNEIESLYKKVYISLHSYEKNVNFNECCLIKYFDADKIKGDIKLRYRKEGDRFTSLGMNGSKKLKDIFIDMKVPKSSRDNIPLICFGDDIAWIVGYRISEKYKIDRNTKYILEVKIESEEQK